MDVFDNVMTGALAAQKNTPELVRKAEELLQRVGIVRAIINEPEILFADEPTGSLNSAAGTDVLDIFTELHEKGQSIVMVTHDLRTALRGSRVIFLRDGNIVGEHEMPPFGTDDPKQRREQLQHFLDEMGW